MNKTLLSSDMLPVLALALRVEKKLFSLYVDYVHPFVKDQKQIDSYLV